MTGLVDPEVELSGMRDASVSREVLGEGYLVGTAVVLNLILLMRLFSLETVSLVWTPIWTVPGLSLLVAVYWLRRTEFREEHIWDVAKYTAFGIGVGTVATLGLTLAGGTLSASGSSTFRFGATVSGLAVVGVFAGTTRDIYHNNQSLDLRNRVLRRVLRHDLRNDMTVVLVNLEKVEAELEGEQREKVAKARQKIEAVVDLTDKVRRVDVSARGDDGGVPVDLVTVLVRRIDLAESTHPEVEIEATLPDSATAWVATDFGMAVDSIVESARSGSAVTPRLGITLAVEEDSVVMTVDDENETIPESDLKAVASGSETTLKHARGVELWLVRWLVEASDGDLTLDEENHRIEIRVDRVTDGHRRGAQLHRWLARQ